MDRPPRAARAGPIVTVETRDAPAPWAGRVGHAIVAVVARLFVALDLPAAVRDALAPARAALPGARWLRREQLHLTLRFLGQVHGAQVDAVATAFADLTASGFALRVQGVGCFPGPARARVLWAGVAPHAPLRALRAVLDARLDPVLGPDPDAARGFHPHITLARLDGTTPRDAIAGWAARHDALSSAPWPARALVLFESFTRPEGALHEERLRRPLAPED